MLIAFGCRELYDEVESCWFSLLDPLCSYELPYLIEFQNILISFCSVLFRTQCVGTNVVFGTIISLSSVSTTNTAFALDSMKLSDETFFLQKSNVSNGDTLLFVRTQAVRWDDSMPIVFFYFVYFFFLRNLVNSSHFFLLRFNSIFFRFQHKNIVCGFWFVKMSIIPPKKKFSTVFKTQSAHWIN